MQTKLPLVASSLVTRFVILCAATVGGLSISTARLVAQATPPPSKTAPAPSVDKDEEAIVLSPFTVTPDNTGYQASHTLSGTRLNTKLEDLGSSITVVTKQQLLDTASLDINDVFRYEASTEGTDNFTSFVRNRAGGVADQVASDPARANRIRGMGTAGTSGIGVNTAFGNFQTNNNIPFDPYNIDAIEISRGPNSNLFGLGAASGTVNLVPSYANLERATYSGTLRFDDWGGHRESLNLNQPLIKGKLAIRAAAVNESKGFTRKPAEEDINRQYATVLYRPFKNTTIRATAERFDDDYRRPNSVTPRSTIPEWTAAGSPTWNPVTQMVRLANGTTSGPYPAAGENLALPAGLIGGFNGFYNRAMAYIEPSGLPPGFFTVTRTINPITTGIPTSPYGNGQNSNLRYLEAGTRVMRFRDIAPPFGTGPVGLPLWIEPGVSNNSVYDWESINVIAPNYGNDKATTYVMELEQTFFRTPSHLLAARAGLFLQNFDRNRYILMENQDTFINIDVNEVRLDGTPNPYFRRPYIQTTNPLFQVRSEDYDIISGDLAYEFTPQKLPRFLSWIGRQRLNFHGERNLIDAIAGSGGGEFASRDLGNHAFTTPANRIGGQLIGERFYIGDNQGNTVDYAPAPIDNINGTYPLTWHNNLTNTWVTEPATIGTVANSGQGARTRTEIRTLSLTAQNSFFRDRLVTTVGWRNDRQQSRTGAGAFVNASTGLADTANVGIFGPAQNFVSQSGTIINLPGWNYQEGDTKTYGAVVKPTSWLNLHYNKSDSFAPQVVRQLVSLDGNVTNPRGKVEEYGFSFSALDRRLNVRVTRYKTTELDSRGSEVGTLGNRYLDMEGRPSGTNTIQTSSFRYFAEQIARERFAAQGNANPSQTQLDPEVAKLMGYTTDQYNLLVYSGPSQPQTVGTTDVSSKGYEVEATFNPNVNWRFKFTGAQTEAQDDNVSGEILDWWLNNRMPLWTTLRNGQGQTWWTTASPAGSGRPAGETPQTRWTVEQYAAYWAASTNAGRIRTQVREWRFAGLGNYEFTSGRLKGLDLGGAVRWESKAAIGYLAGPAETTGPFAGAILFLDNNKPVYDKARSYFDFSAGYRIRFSNDRIRTKVQLNVRNAFEGGRLQPVAINPDGVPYAYRIIDPRQFILSMQFDL